MPIREEAVAFLNLQSGDVVVNVASGPGLSFPLLMKGDRPGGTAHRDRAQSDMMALARQRVEAAGWRNVSLIEGKVDAADVPLAADAVLFHFTHDVLQERHPACSVYRSALHGASGAETQEPQEPS